MGYNIAERSREVVEISLRKWERRRRNEEIESESASSITNCCKFMPGNLVKLINMLTMLCPRCKPSRMVMSRGHLASVHSLLITDPLEFIALHSEKKAQEKRKGTIDRNELEVNLIIRKLDDFIGNT